MSRDIINNSSYRQRESVKIRSESWQHIYLQVISISEKVCMRSWKYGKNDYTKNNVYYFLYMYLYASLCLNCVSREKLYTRACKIVMSSAYIRCIIYVSERKYVYIRLLSSRVSWLFVSEIYQRPRIPFKVDRLGRLRAPESRSSEILTSPSFSPSSRESFAILKVRSCVLKRDDRQSANSLLSKNSPVKRVLTSRQLDTRVCIYV